MIKILSLTLAALLATTAADAASFSVRSSSISRPSFSASRPTYSAPKTYSTPKVTTTPKPSAPTYSTPKVTASPTPKAAADPAPKPQVKKESSWFSSKPKPQVYTTKPSAPTSPYTMQSHPNVVYVPQQQSSWSSWIPWVLLFSEMNDDDTKVIEKQKIVCVDAEDQDKVVPCPEEAPASSTTPTLATTPSAPPVSAPNPTISPPAPQPGETTTSTGKSSVYD